MRAADRKRWLQEAKKELKPALKLHYSENYPSFVDAGGNISTVLYSHMQTVERLIQSCLNAKNRRQLRAAITRVGTMEALHSEPTRAILSMLLRDYTSKERLENEEMYHIIENTLFGKVDYQEPTPLKAKKVSPVKDQDEEPKERSTSLTKRVENPAHLEAKAHKARKHRKVLNVIFGLGLAAAIASKHDQTHIPKDHIEAIEKKDSDAKEQAKEEIEGGESKKKESKPEMKEEPIEPIEAKMPIEPKDENEQGEIKQETTSESEQSYLEYTEQSESGRIPSSTKPQKKEGNEPETPEKDGWVDKDNSHTNIYRQKQEAWQEQQSNEIKQAIVVPPIPEEVGPKTVEEFGRILDKRIEDLVTRLEKKKGNHSRMIKMLRRFDSEAFFRSYVQSHSEEVIYIRKLNEASVPHIFARDLKHHGGYSLGNVPAIVLKESYGSQEGLNRTLEHELHHSMMQADGLDSFTMREGANELMTRIASGYEGFGSYEHPLYRAYLYRTLDPEAFAKEYLHGEEFMDNHLHFKGDKGQASRTLNNAASRSKVCQVDWYEKPEDLLRCMYEDATPSPVTAKYTLIHLQQAAKGNHWKKRKVIKDIFERLVQPYAGTLPQELKKDYKYMRGYLYKRHQPKSTHLIDFYNAGGTFEDPSMDHFTVKMQEPPKKVEDKRNKSGLTKVTWWERRKLDIQHSTGIYVDEVSLKAEELVEEFVETVEESPDFNAENPGQWILLIMELLLALAMTTNEEYQYGKKDRERHVIHYCMDILALDSKNGPKGWSEDRLRKVLGEQDSTEMHPGNRGILNLNKLATARQLKLENSGLKNLSVYAPVMLVPLLILAQGIYIPGLLIGSALLYTKSLTRQTQESRNKLRQLAHEDRLRTSAAPISVFEKHQINHGLEQLSGEYSKIKTMTPVIESAIHLHLPTEIEAVREPVNYSAKNNDILAVLDEINPKEIYNQAAKRVRAKARGGRNRSQKQKMSRSNRREGERLESRPYQPGDDVKNIDWSATARSNEVIVRVKERQAPENGSGIPSKIVMSAECFVDKKYLVQLAEIMHLLDQKKQQAKIVVTQMQNHRKGVEQEKLLEWSVSPDDTDGNMEQQFTSIFGIVRRGLRRRQHELTYKAEVEFDSNISYQIKGWTLEEQDPERTSQKLYGMSAEKLCKELNKFNDRRGLRVSKQKISASGLDPELRDDAYLIGFLQPKSKPTRKNRKKRRSSQEGSHYQF